MLRLEFMSSGSPQCPFLRISGDDLSVSALLKETFGQLAQGGVDPVRISELAGVVAVDDCRLTASVGKRNRGVVQFGDSNSFEWILTPAGWDNNVGLIEPFCGAHGYHNYQWLDSPSNISVLFSPSGQW